MRSYTAGWLNHDGEFTCIGCDTKETHKVKWVVRLASECIVHGKAAKPQKPHRHHKRSA